MKSIDIAWLAGLFEGEGCFSIMTTTRQPNNLQFRMAIGMTDYDIIHRVSRLTKSFINKDMRRTASLGSKYMYRVTLSGKQAIAWMMTIYSYMGERRKARIREIISAWKSYSSNQQKAFA